MYHLRRKCIDELNELLSACMSTEDVYGAMRIAQVFVLAGADVEGRVAELIGDHVDLSRLCGNLWGRGCSRARGGGAQTESWENWWRDRTENVGLHPLLVLEETLAQVDSSSLPHELYVSVTHVSHHPIAYSEEAVKGSYTIDKAVLGEDGVANFVSGLPHNLMPPYPATAVPTVPHPGYTFVKAGAEGSDVLEYRISKMTHEASANGPLAVCFPWRANLSSLPDPRLRAEGLYSEAGTPLRKVCIEYWELSRITSTEKTPLFCTNHAPLSPGNISQKNKKKKCHSVVILYNAKNVILW